MVKYRVTVVKFGLGFASADTIARKCEAHLSEIAAEGWRLVHADRNSFAIPGYWTFIWERLLASGSEADEAAESDIAAGQSRVRASSSFSVKPAQADR